MDNGVHLSRFTGATMTDVQWLNCTNAALGIIAALCTLAVLRAILSDLFHARRKAKA